MADPQEQLQLAVMVLGSGLAVASLLVAVSGTLELMLILGPVLCCRSWWLHQAIMIVLWLPILSLSGWLLHGGWHTGIPFVIMGCVLIAAHTVMLLCYWLRYVLRRQQALELPTQQLLTEAHRMMMGTPGDAAQPTSSGAVSHGRNGEVVPPSSGQFTLQVGRTDGVAGYTLFIPGAAEEAVLQEVAARHFQQKSLRSPGRWQPAGSSSTNGSSSSARVPRSDSTATTPASSFRAFPSRGRHGSPEEKGGQGGGGVPGRAVVQVCVPDAMQRWGSSRTTSARYRTTDSGAPSPVVSGRLQHTPSFRAQVQVDDGDAPGGDVAGHGQVVVPPASAATTQHSSARHPIKQELSNLMAGSHLDRDRPARDNHLASHHHTHNHVMVEESNPLLLAPSDAQFSSGKQGQAGGGGGGVKDQGLTPAAAVLLHPAHLPRLSRHGSGITAASPGPASPLSTRSRVSSDQGPPQQLSTALDNGQAGRAVQDAVNPLSSVLCDHPKASTPPGGFTSHSATPSLSDGIALGGVVGGGGGSDVFNRDTGDTLGNAGGGGGGVLSPAHVSHHVVQGGGSIHTTGSAGVERRTVSGKPPMWPAAGRPKGHHRTLSFPTSSSLTASLLDEQDSSADIAAPQQPHVKP